VCVLKVSMAISQLML